jgi:hypothetical protein
VIREHTKLIARYGGIIAVLFEWLALALFYLSQPTAFNGNLPISYFATLPQTRIIFTLCYVVAAISFWIFATFHLSKLYRTPLRIFAFSMLGFAAMAITPFNPDNTVSNVLHTLFTQSSFFAFLIGMYIMARSNEGKRFHYITILAATFSGVLLILFRFAPPGSHLILPFEAGAWLVCQLWIVWVSLATRR